MSLSAIVGHVPVSGHLERAVREGTLPHGILLVGAEDVGKTSLAVGVAAMILGAAGWPGGLAAHPDFWLEDSDAERILMDRVKPRGRGADQELSLQDFLSLRPYAGGHRVAVLARADRLTEQAANALLKTIEEPPPETHLFLTTAYPERLPQTIVSRCQSFACAPVPANVVQEWLVAVHGVAQSLAPTAAALAFGRPGRALRLATEPGMLDGEVAAIDAFIAVAGTGPGGALRAAGALAPGQGAAGRDVALAQVAAWTSFVRDVACAAHGAGELLVWDAYRPVIERWADVVPKERLTTILSDLVQATERLTQYAIPRLTYEVLFLATFASPASPPPTPDQRRGAITAGPAATAEAAAKAGRTTATRRPRR